MRNKPHGHHVRGWLSLEDAASAPVTFSVNIDGDVRTNDWTGTVALDAEALELAALSRLLNGWRTHTIGTGQIEFSGAASLRISARVASSGAGSADVNFHASGLQVYIRRVPPDGPELMRVVALEHIRLDGDITRADGRWSGQTRALEVSSKSGTWPTGQIALALRHAEATRLELSMDVAPVEPLLGLIAPHLHQPVLRRTLGNLTPRGLLHGIALSTEWTNGALTNAHVEARVEGLVTRASGAIPGLSGVNGRLIAELGNGRFELDPGPMSVNIPTWYTDERALSAATGTVHWTLSEGRARAWTDGLELVADAAQAQVSGTLSWRAGQRIPHVAGRLSLNPGPFSTLAPWILINKIPGNVRAWTQGALVAGKVDSLTIEANGLLNALPFASGNEGFILDAALSGVTLDYARGWPQAQGVAGKLSIRGSRLETDITDGTVFGVRVERFAVLGANLRKRPIRLDLKGNLGGDTGDVLRYVHESPLRERLADRLAGLAATGPSKLAISLNLELPGGKLGGLEGGLTIRANHIDSAAGLKLRNASGEIHFTRAGIGVPEIRASYLGKPVTLATRTGPAGQVLMQMRGTADREFLTRVASAMGMRDESFPADALAGETSWAAERVVNGGSGQSDSVLTITSSLAGLDIDLPGSLGKRARREREFKLVVESSAPTRRRLHIDYGPQWKAALVVEKSDAGWSLERGHVSLGGATASIPAEPGLLVNGRLETFHFDSWNRALSGPDALVGNSATPSNVRSVAIEVQRVRAFDQLLAVQRLILRPRDNGWELTIAGNALDGRVFVPHDPQAGSRPVLVQLNRLKLARSDSDRPYEGRRPSEFPPLDLTVSSTELDGHNLGKLRFRTVPGADGLEIADMSIQGAGFTATGNGSWRFVNGRHTTDIKVTVHAERLAGLLDTFGYGQVGVRDGKTEIHFDVLWDGVPAEFDLAVVSGTLQARASKGRLLDVKPGITGRAFGLLSLAALPAI